MKIVNGRKRWRAPIQIDQSPILQMAVYIPDDQHCCQALDVCFVTGLAYKIQHGLRQAIVSSSRLAIFEGRRYICELSKVLYMYAASRATIKSLDEVYKLGWID